MFLFYSRLNLAGTMVGLILAHTALATPFVVITVTATLSGFDRTLMRAGASLGAPPPTVFFKVVLPLILPGMISGALFAFVISFDESVVVLFLASAGTAHIAEADVLRHPRDDLADHYRGGHGADHLLDLAADYGRASAPPQRAAARHYELDQLFKPRILQKHDGLGIDDATIGNHREGLVRHRSQGPRYPRLHARRRRHAKCDRRANIRR